MAQAQNVTFVLSPSCPSPLFNCTTTDSPLQFIHVEQHKARPVPFARLLPVKGPALTGAILPFARITQTPNDLVNSLRQGLISDEVQQQRSLERRGHDDDWYQDRCIFCAQCKAAINSTYNKKGSRCQGCRRWFHDACRKQAAGTSKQQTPEALTATTTKAATAAAGATGIQHEQTERRTSRLFLHDDDCKQVYQRLAAVAAAGEQPMPLPVKRSLLPWQQQQSQVMHTWRLLDLTDIKLLYKDAQRHGTLHKQMKSSKQQLEHEAAANSNSRSTGNGQAAGSETAGDVIITGSSKRPIHSRLDEFLVVCELMKSLGDSPKDLLEDSFAVITKDGRGAALSVGTLNVFGSDHARIQGIVTAQHCRRHGHGSRLVGQLESVLQGAGVQQLVVVLEPQDDDSSHDSTGRTPTPAVEHWFKKHLGFSPASSEQYMLWRRELPEYHKNLIGGCQLLVKPLQPKSQSWW